jgi:sec-independent protein translocase protein TatA
MPGWFGPWELLIVLAVVLLIFGPKRLPQLGRSLGRGAREFKDSITGRHDKDDEPEPEPAELPPPEPKREKVS